MNTLSPAAYCLRIAPKPTKASCGPAPFRGSDGWLLEDVTDEELGPLVAQLLKDGVQSHVSVDTIEFEIAKQIAANFPRAVIRNQDRTKLATEMMGLARASRLWKEPKS
jgi:hypothetical protein